MRAPAAGFSACSTAGRLHSDSPCTPANRDLTEASIPGASLSLVATFIMVFLFGMELQAYLSVQTSTQVIVDKSRDGDLLRINFNVSFPNLSCEFASVDIKDAVSAWPAVTSVGRTRG